MTEREIFVAALQIDDSDAQSDYVSSACGPDAGLRLRVKVLLNAHCRAGNFLERSAAAAVVTACPPLAPAETPGTIIGPYKLVEQIGEGGMGLVFMAEQSQPVRRLVALKVLKPGLDTRHVLARFEAERQALALMDHPHIAKVFDAGTTPAGRPYFVMELVRGVPITDFCDQHRLDPRRRLQLFVEVCRAVQHAHQKGVIHRDLKPSNVLVTLHDTVAVPKVIDFGIAKATGERLTERTLVTHFAQMVGTPLYMSPEQAEMNGLDVDTRSDVYALGVLLYELLTGATPFGRERLKSAGCDEVRRILREEEPPRPSRQVATLGAAAVATVAERRGVDARQFGHLLRGDLDWIVMKALEKDRNRRYESASAFAQDVERYLAGEAVVARPPSAAYRLRKFAGRHKAALAATGVVVAALVAATAVSTWQAVEARRAQHQAEAAEGRAASEAAIAKAVKDFLQTDLLKPTDPEAEEQFGFAFNPNLTVREALDRAAATIEQRFHDQPLVEAAIRDTISQAYTGVGEQKLALTHAQRSVALYEATLGLSDVQALRAMDRLARAYQRNSQLPESVIVAERALEARTARFGPDHPETLVGMLVLAVRYGDAGRYSEAIALCKTLVARCDAAFGRDHPTTERALSQLAESYAKGGKWEQCAAIREPWLEKAKVTYGPEHPKSIALMDGVARCYEHMGRLDEALQMRETVLANMRTTLGPEHNTTCGARLRLAIAYMLAGRLEEADGLLREAVLVARKLARFRGPMGSPTIWVLMSQNLLLQHRYVEAEPWARELLEIEERLRPDYWERFNAMSLVGGVLLGQQRYAEAEPFLVQGYEGMREREETIWRWRLAWLTDGGERLVRYYEETNQPVKAKALREKLSRPPSHPAPE